MTPVPVPELVVVRGAAADITPWAATWAAEKPGWRARVNTADLARMLYGADHNTHTGERVAKAVRSAAVEALLHRGVSVVVDDPYVDDDTVRGWDAVAWACAGRLRVVDLRPGGVP